MLNLENLIFLSGIFQIMLVAGSLVIPKVLKWKEEFLPVSALIRQMFWTYAAYILAINLFFGLVSAFAPEELCNGSFLAFALTLFIGLYWVGRIGIQFFYFDRKSFPAGKLYLLGEVLLVCLFICLAIVYLAAAYANFTAGSFPGTAV